MHALFIIRMLHHIICLPLFNIYNWFISQNPDFFTDLQQTVCGCNWFISQNPDFINVVENVDFAKSRFFLFRRIQIFFISQFRKIHISQNPVSRFLDTLFIFDFDVCVGIEENLVLNPEVA